MYKFHRTIIEPAFAFLTLGSMAWAQHSGVMPADLVNRVSQMYQDSKQYSFEGDLEIARRGGTENPRELLLKAKVKMAVAPAGKYNLQVEMNNNSSYVVVS